MSIHRNSIAAQLQKSFTTSELVALRFEFNRFDVDNSNTIDKEELRQVVKNLSDGVELSDQQLGELMAEVDDDGSGEIDWEEYLELIIALRSGRGLRAGAVSGLLSRPPLIMVVEAELGHRKFVVRLLREVRLDSDLIPQGKIEVVDFKDAESALDFMRNLPPSRKCALCICDTHGVLATKFCSDLETECLVPPPVAFFATEKHKGDPLPHLVQQYILKDNFDARTAERLVESFCIEKDSSIDHDNDPTTKSGHLRKKGMIGGRGRQGHSSGTTNGTYRKKNTVAAKTRLVRAPKSFAKNRWKGALSALSPRALAQLAVVGGGGEGSAGPKVFHVDPKAKAAEEAEERRLIEEKEAQIIHENELMRQIYIEKQKELNRPPSWKLLVTKDIVRTCSGLHYVDSSTYEGEITSPRLPENNGVWSPRSPRSPMSPMLIHLNRRSEENDVGNVLSPVSPVSPSSPNRPSPRHNKLQLIHSSPSQSARR
jgi:hypothetical protein